MMHSGKHPHQNAFDFSKKPFLVIWETTHACDLACVHCRASAEPEPSKDELTLEDGFSLIEQVWRMGTPILVLSGGDPLKRKELPEWIRFAKSLGLRLGVIPAVTPALTPDKIAHLKQCGVDQIAFSLDAATSEVHDSFRRTQGVFDRTLEAVKEANQLGLSVQINSLINVHNQASLKTLIDLVEQFEIVFWEVFFLVPTGRGKELPIMSAEKFDDAFEAIYQLSKRVSFMIKVTEAPHYRRYYIEQELKHQKIDNLQTSDRGIIQLPDYLKKATGLRGSIGRAPQGVNAGKGFAFVSCRGEVMPSGFLPLVAGNVKYQLLSDIYQSSPVFKTLRDSASLKGRCGKCSYRDVCGGSRSRSYALTGDYLAEDPCCAYPV